MPATYEALSQGGHEAMATEIFTKIKDYLDTHGADSKVSKAGDTMTGNLNINGMDVNLKTTGSSSDDSGDIVFYYGNGQEKVRLWTANDYTAAAGINYRVYKKDGTSLYSGTLATYKQLTDYFSSIGTENTTDTWIPVWKSNHFEHCGRDIWTSVSHTNHATNKDRLVTMSVLSFWNGAHNASHNSNLQYCNRGAFGTIVTKNSGDYLPVTGGTMTGGINWNGSSGYTNGLYWKESGYGDQFKIYPIFSGADDNNALVIATAAGGAGTTPALTNKFFFRPSGYLDLTNRTRWNTKQEIYNNDVYMILGTSNMVCVRTYNNINAAKPIQAASFQTYSSRLIKKNITDITQDEAKSLLNLRVVDFDYIEQVGGQTNQTGIIAEEALTVYPKCVDIPENYNEDEVKKAIETGDAINAMNVDYTKLIAPLIKLVQMQQKEIDELKERR